MKLLVVTTEDQKERRPKSQKQKPAGINHIGMIIDDVWVLNSTWHTGAIFYESKIYHTLEIVMRYRISENVKLMPLPENLKPGNNRADIAGNFLIKDKKSKRQFIINTTAKIFIEKFYTPKTFEEVKNEVAEEVKAPAEDVKEIIYPFFRYIKYRDFIVPEHYIETKIKATRLFNKGSILDRYAMERIIDVSDSIDIYKAVDLRSEKNIIIKLLKERQKEKIEAFNREFNFLKALTKTSVVPNAYLFIKKETYTYFTQDFIDGSCLPQFISRKRKSTPGIIIKIVSNILWAFKKIHAKNIVHGDIHPGNILVTRTNEIKIIDFGLAINYDLDKNEIVSFGGAYFFMPPERIKTTTYKKFTRKPDFYSDVYQLGVVLYTFLYDEHPFNGITWEELATQIKEKRIEFPERSQYGFLVPEWIRNIIAKCVSKRPSNRFANAEELYAVFSKNMSDNACKIRPAVKI